MIPPDCDSPDRDISLLGPQSGYRCGPSKDRKSSTGNVKSVEWYRYIYCWGHCDNHMDIPMLPFCKVSLKAQKAPAPAYPETLKTLGDHLRKRRFDLRLLQRQAAQKLGVDKTSVHNWETTGPRRRFLSCPKLLNLFDIFPLRPLTKILTKRLKHIAKYWEYSKITRKATGNRSWHPCLLGEREG
jgi:DNA-binding XRE family transcriptional regulator